jgi:hypothetical protein
MAGRLLLDELKRMAWVPVTDLRVTAAGARLLQVHGALLAHCTKPFTLCTCLLQVLSPPDCL